jgi:hypothetical protein
LAAGVYVTFAVQLDPAPLGVQVVPDTVPTVPWAGLVTANVNAALSISVPASVITLAVSSGVVWLCAVAVGTSFTAVIVTVTVAAAEVNAPSFVVNVKLSGPV